MYNKYKIKRKKHANIYVVFLAIIIFLLFLSTGYALLTDNLKIEGKANIKPGKTEPDVPTMGVEVVAANMTVLLPSGATLVSNEVVNGQPKTTIKTVSSNSQTGIYSFYFTNNSGYEATNGTTVINVTGNTDAIGTIQPTLTASVPYQTQGIFHAYIPINTDLVKVETTIDILIKYTINGQDMGFHYIVIVQPGM